MVVRASVVRERLHRWQADVEGVPVDEIAPGRADIGKIQLLAASKRLIQGNLPFITYEVDSDPVERSSRLNYRQQTGELAE